MLTTIRSLGHGGFAEVFLVEENGNYYAKKCLKPNHAVESALGMDELKTRFLREIRYQSAIDSPNVVKILTTFPNDTPPAFVMELANETLEDEITRDGTLGGDPSRVLYDILSGLEAIHDMGFVHRDLKPSNVLKFSNNNLTRYAISDFGLMSSPDGNTTTLTSTDARGGTPYYAAPELIVSMKKATIAADIYSFGAILHDIFVNSTRIPYSELSGPGEIGKIIEKCTKQLPIRRYKSVSELRDALFMLLSTTPLTFSSNAEEEVITLLQNNATLTNEQWDKVFIFSEFLEPSSQATSNIMKSLALSHLQQLSDEAPELFAAIGKDYFRYSLRGGFDFDYCDVIAGKLEFFFLNGTTEMKALSLFALLVLGTSHNRWLVEHKFEKYAGVELDANVARRFLMETDNAYFSYYISHLERSINFNPSTLHPVLGNALLLGRTK